MPQNWAPVIDKFLALDEADRRTALGRMNDTTRAELIGAIRTRQNVSKVVDPKKNLVASPPQESTVDSRMREAEISILEPFSARDAAGNWQVPPVIQGALDLIRAVDRFESDPKKGIAELRDLAKGAVGGVVEPPVTYAKSVATGDYDAASGASGRILTQTVPAVAGAAEAVKAGTSGMIPNRARAGAKLNQVDAAAGKIPIDARAVDDIALRAQELSTRGATLPKHFRDYLKSRGNAKDMTYSEGRDFAKNSGRLSAAEKQTSNPEMKMLTGKFYDALKTANRDAAAKVGMEKIYDAAINEFRRASTISEAMEVAAKWAKVAAITGAAGAGAARLYRALAAP